MASKVTVQLSKNNGSPQAVVYVAKDAKLVSLQGAITGLFKDKSALEAVGLRFCEGCKSGLDILIRTRFEAQIDVESI